MYKPCVTLFRMDKKTCCDCKLSKPLDEFHNSNGHSQKKASRCIPCQATYGAAWYKKNKERIQERMRGTAYMRYYGITIDEYDVLYEEQNRGCAICSAPTGSNNKRLAVDHNHETGEVRGLLCDDCNTGLGKFKDNPNLLAIAINYLS